MAALGVLFLLVVLGQSLATDAELARWLAVAGWVLWGIFVAEFAFRAYVAPDRRRFWRRNWWQLLFLAVPFLRFVRAVRGALRFLRAARVLSSAVRGSRSAGRLLSSRIGWLAVVTGVVVLAASQLLLVTGSYGTYGPALHDTTLATVTGEPLRPDDTMARLLNVVLAVYSVAVFATLAGALGAYFLRRDDETVPVRSSRAR